MPDINNRSFVFRLQSDNEQHDLSNTIKHWGESQMYDDKQINAIESTNKKSLSQPTSIPSPFARIALVKTAFDEVARYGEDALDAYQKIVSDTLDVAEIFFKIDKLKDQVEIIVWKYGRRDNNPELEEDSDLRQLQNSHRQVYKTLKTFLENDADAYNFDIMKGIYILKYRDTGDIIGATSPCTLFFSSANDYSGLRIKLNSERNAFEGIFPLHKRSWSFQKYLYSWIAQYNEIRNVDGRAFSRFHEFINYLEAQKPLINRTREIEALKTIDTNAYQQLRAPDVEVLGKPLYKSTIVSPEDWTVEDILEDVVIRLPYKINKESFFDGNLPDESKNAYLLPIKDLFFEEYSIEDLKRFIKINHSGDVVEVEVKIDNQSSPIRRTYRKSKDEIIELIFDCAIFPNVKFSNENIANYRFGLVCDYNQKDKFSVEFIKIGATIEPNKKRLTVRNETHSKNRQLKNYSLVGSNFDYIKINYNGISGIIIPNLELREGFSKFTFAVDFGTTNTHIEYRVDNGIEIKSFDISKKQIDERQVHYLHGGEDLLKNYFDEEYIPSYTDEEFKFPMRTALSYGEDTNWSNVYPFEKASLNELYEKRIDYPYNKTETNLKWSDAPEYQNQVKAYIESIMYILRNKVILNHGSLADTKIIWFYPLSMERKRYENLVKVWKEAYKNYFGGAENNIISINESIAPFEYYIKDGDTSNLVTIDIGGETTDIVIANNGEAEYITSFRFAANAIFGDGYSETGRVKNGIVRQFSEQIKKELKTVINENDEVFQIFDDMFTNKRSDDIASFLFSLKHNKRVRSFGQNLADNVNLNKKLINDTTQKITFIFFYTAIIYHLSNLMKAMNLNMPDKIVFSGNGSQVILFLTDDESILKDYTKLIFEKVYNCNYPSSGLTIIPPRDIPKAATCKGGLYLSKPYDYESILNKKIVLHSNGTNQVIQISNSKETDKYQFINNDYLEKTVEEVNKFINFVFDNLSFFTKKGYQLNSDSIAIAKEKCTEKLSIYAESGWKRKKKEVDNDELINESLFFYPLKGMLKELTDAICDKNVNK
ncbi:MAG TPA: cell division protein FtsA [Bacteroidales bacterium]|nr:cell division protein FtsA [Bacteroidales bacterium]